VAQSNEKFDHRQPMRLSVEIATRQQGAASYFCGVDFLVDDTQIYGGTWQASPNQMSFAGAWQGAYINENYATWVFAYKKIKQAQFYGHVVEWKPPLTWKISVNGKGATYTLPNPPAYHWERAPYEPMHVGLYAVQPGVCYYRNLTVTGALA
jgi:hypothetical protein